MDNLNGYLIPVTGHTIDDVVVDLLTTYLKYCLHCILRKHAVQMDRISPTILKECAHELSNTLSALFNYTLSVGKLPQEWKAANIVAIYKSGERCSAENYLVNLYRC